MKNLNLNNQGFSLLEIMVVVGIMAILTLIGIPAYNGYRASATRSVAVTNTRNIASAYRVCRATGGTCNSFIAIQMEDLEQQKAADPITGNEAICFGLEQRTGSEEVKSCVSINYQTGRASYTIGWYPAGAVNPANGNSEKMCFCADDGTGANLVLQGSEVACTTDAVCTGRGYQCGNNRSAKCLAQQGVCQSSTGFCL